MSTLGAMLAGFAVAVGGVMVGRKLEKLKASLKNDSRGHKQTNKEKKEQIIDAEMDPETGVYHHRK